MKTVAILIAGKAGVGKTTLAKIIADQLNIRGDTLARILPMAKAIKEVARDVFGWDGKKDAKGRRLLQVIGTEAGREYNSDIWVRKAIEWFDNDCNTVNRLAIRPLSTCIMIVDDIRFPNEIERCQEHFDQIYPVCVYGPVRIEMPADTSEHISENSLATCDISKWPLQSTVYNTGDMHELERSAVSIADYIGAQLEDDAWEDYMQELER